MPDGQVANFSGKNLLRIFAGFGFREFSQRGSHVKLRRALLSNVEHTLTIVRHAVVDRGTLHAIYRQALRFIPESELRPHFYSE